MSTKKKEQDKGNVNAFAGVEALSDLNKEFAKALTQASQSYLQGIVAMQEGLLGLANNQMRQLEKTRDDISSATYANESIRIQETWARKVSEQYIYEAQRLVEFANKTSTHSWSPIFPAASPNQTSGKPSAGRKSQAGRSGK